MSSVRRRVLGLMNFTGRQVPRRKPTTVSIAHRVIIAEARDVGLKEVLGLAGGELIVSQTTGTLTEGLLKLMALLADELRLVPRGIAAL